MNQPTYNTVDWSLFACLLSEAALIIATWPLWTRLNAFPVVPLLAGFSDVPIVVDCALVAVLLLCLAVLSVLTLRTRSVLWPSETAVQNSTASEGDSTKKKPTLFLAIALAVSLALAVLNQHRLQPWHWLFMLVLLQTLCLREPRLTAIRRMTIASIYIFAAVSRFGPDVVSGMSRQVLSVAVEAFQVDHLLKNESFVFAACATMSIVELLCGLMLLAPATRRYGILFAVLLHAVLLVTLGPLGLNHNVGVLLWNTFFLFAVPILFGKEYRSALAESLPDEAARSRRRLWLFGGFLFLFPLSGLFGLADNWLSWQLYSPRPEVVRVFVHQDAIGRLPKPAQQFILPPAPLDEWCPLRIDRWSLFATGAPLYPEDRFQLAMAKKLTAMVGGDAIRIRIEQPDIPWWWQRSETELDAAEDAGNDTKKYWLNTNVVREP